MQWALPGIATNGHRFAYVSQLIESIRRVRYISVILQRPIDPRRSDPSSELFDPYKGAALLSAQGNFDEACWQVFISVHFGKHRTHGWRCARAVYGGLGGQRWDWRRVSTNPQSFRDWLAQHQSTFSAGGPYGGFGNHRKYQSLDATSPSGTGAAFETYVGWIGTNRSHAEFFQNAVNEAGDDPRQSFARLYDSMSSVASFGRTARFDYLTMIAKLGLAPIVADRPYLQGATGPLRGAKLLFLGDPTSNRLSTNELESRVIGLGQSLNVGMQEMEDSLCNWQKSPGQFRPYRG